MYLCCLKVKDRTKFANLQGKRSALEKKNQENYFYVVPVLASTAHKNQIRETKQLVQSNLDPHYPNFKRFYSWLALVYAMGLWNCLE